MTDIDTARLREKMGGGSYMDTATIKALLDEIDHLRARLEVVDGWGEDADGIACRNDTIRLQDERIAKLEAELAEARKERALIVAFLDAVEKPGGRKSHYWSLARAIERGEHLKEQTDGE